MSKMRYGPRFSQHGGGGYKYNETDDMRTRELNAHMSAIWQHMPKYKKDLAYHNKKVKHREQKAKLDHERHEAELRMIEAIHKCVEILEFRMVDMMDHLPVPGERKLINQIGVHNAIYQLRHKCGVGVKFEGGSEYDHTLHSDKDLNHRPDPEIDKEITRDERSQVIVEGMKRQREARERHYREIADRLIARAKS